MLPNSTGGIMKRATGALTLVLLVAQVNLVPVTASTLLDRADSAAQKRDLGYTLEYYEGVLCAGEPYLQVDGGQSGDTGCSSTNFNGNQEKCARSIMIHKHDTWESTDRKLFLSMWEKNDCTGALFDYETHIWPGTKACQSLSSADCAHAVRAYVK
ncbi:uncharacterized protein EHS24_003880 [Apiotrichum porosum]|uniref:Ecp2 effector protein domain-containing protein n=1 Tax=Apiotrichum porosum TaxID=105984 RepID=A0A427XDU6_9TREE|nr:uncharacterized protein EHS24_003880 [Apiotrichum porosum]RSH76943.1 hypothetical protein EHS24_003880 [Apiotrichum porosum]